MEIPVKTFLLAETARLSVLGEEQMSTASDDSDVLTISSLRELQEREIEILRRIRAIPNGERLFLANPFLLLAGVGVELAPEVREALSRRHPNLSGLTSTAYIFLKEASPRQSIRVTLQGLFQWSAQ